MITIGDYSISMMVVWLIVFAVMLALELASMGLTTIWFAIGAIVAAVTDALGLPMPVQVVVFVVVSLLVMVAVRPLAVKYFNKDREKTNVDSVIGQQVKVTKEIHNEDNQGEVVLNGMPWKARSKDGDVIPEGIMVTVNAVEGVTLIVER